MKLSLEEPPASPEQQPATARSRLMAHGLLLVLFAFLLVPNDASSQDGLIGFDTDRWHLGAGAKIVQFAGRQALTGTAYLKGAEFLNGTIEADLWTTGEKNFAGFMFRIQSDEEYEWCWLRMHKTYGEIPDGIQYAPVYRGVACWQLYGGPGAMGPVNVPKNEWVHMKIEVFADTAKLYVKNMTEPVMVMDHLQLGRKSGSVGLLANLQKGLYFSNFAYHLDENRQTTPPEAKVIPPNVLARWTLSSPFQVQDFEAISTYPMRRLGEIKTWITPEVDASGLVNITRYHGRTGGLPDCAILRTFLEADQPGRVRMKFGYSDAVAIFLNQQPLFWGNSAFLSRNRAYGGWINFNDAVFLDLKKGRNELLIVTAEDFGGWGFQARLDDVQGIAINPD
jgi:hypothetical protein